MKYVYAKVSADDHARLIKLAAEQGRTLSDLIRESVDDWLEGEAQPPLDADSTRRRGTRK